MNERGEDRRCCCAIHLTCARSHVRAALDPATIDFVFTPKTGDKLFYNDVYEIKYQASSGVTLVNIVLYRMAPSNPTQLWFVGYIAVRVANTGVYKWTVTVR